MDSSPLIAFPCHERIELFTCKDKLMNSEYAFTPVPGFASVNASDGGFSNSILCKTMGQRTPPPPNVDEHIHIARVEDKWYEYEFEYTAGSETAGNETQTTTAGNETQTTNLLGLGLTLSQCALLTKENTEENVGVETGANARGANTKSKDSNKDDLNTGTGEGKLEKKLYVRKLEMFVVHVEGRPGDGIAGSSWGYKKGIHPGDEVVQIGGKSVMEKLLGKRRVWNEQTQKGLNTILEKVLARRPLRLRFRRGQKKILFEDLEVTSWGGSMEILRLHQFLYEEIEEQVVAEGARRQEWKLKRQKFETRFGKHEKDEKQRAVLWQPPPGQGPQAPTPAPGDNNTTGYKVNLG